MYRVLIKQIGYTLKNLYTFIAVFQVPRGVYCFTSLYSYILLCSKSMLQMKIFPEIQSGLFQVYFVLTTVRMISPNWLKPLSVVTWMIYIAIFWKIGDPFPIHNPKHGVLSVETCISRVGSSFFFFFFELFSFKILGLRTKHKELFVTCRI